MQGVRKYVDEMFRELPNSKRAKELKAEIISNMEERYLELSENNSDINQVEKQLITEIGTSKEIRENINLDNSKRQIILLGIELIVFILAISYSIYAKINDPVFRMEYNILPMWIAHLASNPIAIFTGTILFLTIVNHMIKPQTIFIQNKSIRLSLLIASILMIALYLIMILRNFGIIHFPFIHWKFFYHISNNINIIAAATGVFYYMGTKK